MKINFKLFLLVSIFSILIPISVVYAAQGTVRIFFPSGTTNPVGAQVTVVGTDGSGNNIQAPAISTTLYPSAVTPPSATISTSPTSCTENCNVTVSWNSSNVENIVRIYRNGAFWINATANASGSATDWTLPAGTYEYCIRAVNNSWVEGGNLACATTTVNPLPQNISVSITASPQTMTLPTNSTNLTWTTTGSPTSCTASGSWSGTKSATGGTESRTGLTAGTYTYTITCSKSGVPNAVASVTVTVNAASTIGVSITASPQTMTLPTNSTNLTWTTTGSPTSCTASGSWSGTKSATGGTESRTGLTAGTYTYTITCSKSGVPNAVVSVTVTVNSGYGPTGVDLKISTHAGQTNIDGPAWTYSQGPYTISWGAVSGATACNINGTNVSTSGGSWNLNMLLGQTTANYTLSCSNSNGTTIDTATVHVPPPPTNGAGTCPAPGTTGTFSWTAPNVTLGGISTWNTFYTRARVSGGANLGSPAWDDNFVGTSKNFSSVVGTSYDWWVHTKHTPTGSWSDQIGGSFTCQSANFAQCDGTWREVPGSGYTPSQPVLIYLSSTKSVESSLLDSIVSSVRGTDNNVYLNICNFSGGPECIWGGWSSVPGSVQTTDSSPYIWTGGTSFDLFIRNTLNTINYHKYNNTSGWFGWDNSGSSQQELGKPFRTTDKLGRVWQIRKNANSTISYMCGATGCVSLPFNSTNSSFTPATVNAGDPVTVYCDYNLASNNAIGVSSTGLTGCTFQSFNGKTQARFNCTAGSASGGHNVYCVNNSSTSDNVCSQSNLLGTITINAPVVNTCTGMEGLIKRDLWTGISGNLVTNLTSNPNYPNSPNSTTNLSSIKTTTFGDSYGQRIYGLLKAPATGQYRFYIASDDYSDLYLSTDTNPANKTRIAYVAGWTNVDEWTKYTSQRSGLISLVAGNTYFIEAIHKEGSGGDNVSVGWTVPGSTTIELISSTCLSRPPTPITVSVGASPTTITLPTNSTTISWSTTGSPTSCTLTRGSTGLYTGTNTSFTDTGLTAGTYTYTVTCSKSGVSDAVGQIIVTVNSAVTPTYSLTVIKSGQGTVTSSSNPAQTNINCGSVCTISYDEGTSVDLTAEPGTGRIFTGWSGGGCTGRGTCSTTINGNTTIIANFAIDPNYKEF